jgi:DNA polymerase-3 subunit gamma/tau
VVGQEAVVRTLRNAIERNAVHHAYLFVGSRGTGKTSMAKILAAALNCENGPTLDPCGTCTACEAIANSTSLDVIEMDAASNNSVDDIRELRERVALAPVSGTHKVYILDEAHMLSSQAWNAFLKTLEEPPPNTVFVLATTEAHKILPTVADRCHRFDFQRPSTIEVGEVVARVAEAEGITAAPEVLSLVARSADGSFRDALGTLEQLVTYAGEGGEISQGDALTVLGVVDSELRFKAIDSVCDSDPAAAVRTAAEIAESGRDVRRFMEDLEAHARALLLVDLIGDVPPELAVGGDSDKRLAEQSRRLGRAGAIRLLDLIAEAFSTIGSGSDPRLRLELLLVKAADSGAGSGGRETAQRTAAAAPAQQSAAVSAEPTPRPPSQPAGSAGPAAALKIVEEPEEQPIQADAGIFAGGTMPPSGEVVASWPQVIARLRSETPMIAALLAKAWPHTVDGSKVTIAFPPAAEFHCRKAQDERCRDAIKDAFTSVLGARPDLVFEIVESESPLAEHEQRSYSLDQVAEILVAEFGAVEIDPPAVQDPAATESHPDQPA